MLRRTILVTLVLLGCTPLASAPVVPAPAPAPAQVTERYPRELLWVRTAAEHDASFIQTFRLARARLAQTAAGRSAGTWAIISDADETLIDNSEYERRRLPFGPGFDSAAWGAWVRERGATAKPGALEYVNAVRSLGGRVVIVTNRSAAECDDTRANLTAVGLVVDLVLCRGAVSDKNPRYESVQAGTTGSALPPLEVLQWMGDNIQDFPRMTQRSRAEGPAAFALFGERYFVLPNPMYGSFDRNQPR